MTTGSRAVVSGRGGMVEGTKYRLHINFLLENLRHRCFTCGGSLQSFTSTYHRLLPQQEEHLQQDERQHQQQQRQRSGLCYFPQVLHPFSPPCPPCPASCLPLSLSAVPPKALFLHPHSQLRVFFSTGRVPPQPAPPSRQPLYDAATDCTLTDLSTSWWDLYVRGENPQYPPRQEMYAFLTARGVDVRFMEVKEIEDFTKWIQTRKKYGKKFPQMPFGTLEDKIEEYKEKHPLAGEEEGGGQ
eukprot:GHVQ01015553.1.p1 GENE.GHVQ01015553.1~~GHVQ01015553.1.p1  ORF type:complete len:242 (-),score=38.67 GHVQ01015553.1:1281-2006(-)